MPQFSLYLLHLVTAFSLMLVIVRSLPAGGHSDPATLTQSFLPSSPPSTIPAFPEQSDTSTCPLDLPEPIFPSLTRACSGPHLSARRCCPTLSAWLYAAYARTALRPRAGAQPYDAGLPVQPDDSETCVDQLEKAMRARGLDLARPNGTCDLVYCYCGIRLHVLSCSGTFRVSEGGRLVGDERVGRLEKDCHGGGASGRAGCTRCLKTLYQLNDEKTLNDTDVSERKSRMRNKDCQLMGLTWLLAKNTSAYIPTVTSILRTFMMNGQDASSEPQSCSVGKDGMPMAVDSAELDDLSLSAHVLQPPSHLLKAIIWVCIIIFGARL